jgi:hypothetical protein
LRITIDDLAVSPILNLAQSYPRPWRVLKSTYHALKKLWLIDIVIIEEADKIAQD